MEIPSGAKFATHLDSLFTATALDRPEIELALTKVDHIRQDPVTESFSLLFRAPVDASPEQDLFTITHPELGEMDLLLVPVKRTEDGLYFEAFINKLKSEKAQA